MQPLRRTLSFLFVLLVIYAPLQVFAAPRNTGTSDKSTGRFAAQHYHRSPSEPSRGSLRWLPQLTWLRNTGINNFLRRPLPPPTNAEKLIAPPATAKLPAKLLAHYGRDVVLRFNISTPYEEKMLADAADHLMLDVWEFTNDWADIRIGEDSIPSLLDWLPKSLQKSYTHLMVDLVDTIYQQYPSSESHIFSPSLKSSHDGADGVFFSEYQPLSVIHPWMRLLAAMFTTHVRIINIGTTYEGRDILALRVGVSPHLSQEYSEPRKTIIVSGGLHAREWISVSTVTYIAWSLINSYGKSPGITKLLQEFDFVFIPTVNPDGYVYTWESDRLWRKNRQQTSIKFCQGLDLDRGFGFEWDGHSAQANPCSESYPGEQPFQALESHRLAEWAKNETENNGVTFVGFLDFHSYSQQVLYPYSYSCDAHPPSLENLEELAMGLAKAIRISSGELYGVASACEGAVSSAFGRGVTRLETGGGSAMDWFYHEMRVRYSYQIKLRDTGSYGFLLPKENIIPTGDEAFNAVKYFGDFLLGNKGIESGLLHELYQRPLFVSPKRIFSGPADDEEVDYGTEAMDWEGTRRRRR